MAGQVQLWHNARGDLTRVENAAGGTTTLTYDAGGRKLTMDDADLGLWTYAYDRLGNLTRQTDARGQSTCLYYQGWSGRLAGKTFRSDSVCPATGSYDLAYQYDAGHSASGRSRGQLTDVAYADGRYRQTLAYDAQGLLAGETVTITGAPSAYTTSYDYDAYGRLTTTTYPNGDVVTVGYTGRGLPASLGSETLGTLVDSVAYDTAARLTQMRFPAGGGLWRTQRYYPWQDGTHSNSNGRLRDIRVGTSPGGDDRLSLLYGYDSFGNIGGLAERYDGGSTSTFSFTYDDQNRLTNAFDQSYSYDHAGRLTGYEGTTNPVDGAFPIHAVKGDAYAYDANGNLTQRDDQTLTWDAENRLASIVGEGINESYLYDADGIRVQKTSGETTTYYPFPHYEVTVAASGTITATATYQFNGQPIAMRRGGTLTYLHSDHLGSVALTTDGSTVEQQYYAYGRKRGGGTLPSEHNYTGQRRDASGLLYYHARYYDPQLGAFISPDTIVPEPVVLSDYNRYAYGRGNPLKYMDPTGHQSAVFDDSSGGGGGVVVSMALLAVASAMAADTANDYGPPPFEPTSWGSIAVLREPAPTPQPVTPTNFPLLSEDELLAPGDGYEWTVTEPLGGLTQQILPGPELSQPEMGSNIVFTTQVQQIKSLTRAIRSLQNNVDEHQKKLEDYMQNPDAYDNQGFLRNAPSELIRQRIIQGRIAHLEAEIQNWKNQIEEFQWQLDGLTNNQDNKQ